MVEQVQRWLPRARRALFEIYRQQAASSWIEADGQSMQPLIHPGDWMLVEFGALPTAVGEIVLFSRGDSVVAHRVVAHRRGSAPLITKGDAEPYCDPPLGAADVLGVVRALRHGPHSPPSGAGCRGPSARDRPGLALERPRRRAGTAYGHGSTRPCATGGAQRHPAVGTGRRPGAPGAHLLGGAHTCCTF